MQNKKFKDILVIGLALFSMYFGAGNLIFPPMLGQKTGAMWFVGFVFFFIFDMGLVVFAILAVINKGENTMESITGVMGKIPSTIINCSIILCLGPLLVIPRTAATTYEISIEPSNLPLNSWMFSGIFFVMVALLTLRPNKVIDIIGNYLTPILFIGLLALIIKGIINPLGQPTGGDLIFSIKEGTLSGYQTLDPLGSMVFVMLIVGNAMSKGYTEKNDLTQITIKSSLIATFLLFIIYSGLTYLGATTVGNIQFENLTQTQLITRIIFLQFGSFGAILLGIIVFLACLTTAIGLTSSMATFFDKLTDGKVSYKTIVFITCGFSFFTANLGVSTIIKFSAPVLMIMYPVVLILVTLSFFHKKIKSLNTYRFPVYGAMFIELCEVIGFKFVESLPLQKVGFCWLVPAMVCGIIGYMTPHEGMEQEEKC